MKNRPLNKRYDVTIEDIATAAYVHAALRETMFAKLDCPQCGADAYLTPWHEGHHEWWCLVCNWQGNAPTTKETHNE